MSISRIAELFKRRIGGLVGYSRNTGDRLEGREGFYRMAKDCQIPELGYLYERYLGRRTDGVFVEIGAFDGEYVSNTGCLADLGWRGFYIEPVKQYYERCRVRHERNKLVEVCNLAIGAEATLATLNIAGPLSSARADVIKHFSKWSWSRDFISGLTQEVRQAPLDAFLAERGVSPGFDVLVVDVEGMERDVFDGFSLSRWRPKLIVIELHDQNPAYEFLHKGLLALMDRLHDSHYRVAYKDLSNTVCVEGGVWAAAVRAVCETSCGPEVFA